MGDREAKRFEALNGEGVARCRVQGVADKGQLESRVACEDVEMKRITSERLVDPFNRPLRYLVPQTTTIVGDQQAPFAHVRAERHLHDHASRTQIAAGDVADASQAGIDQIESSLHAATNTKHSVRSAQGSIYVGLWQTRWWLISVQLPHVRGKVGRGVVPKARLILESPRVGIEVKSRLASAYRIFVDPHDLLCIHVVVDLLDHVYPLVTVAVGRDVR
eukprot:26037-Prymnesium_polylepis.1